MSEQGQIRQFNIFSGEAPRVQKTPYGAVGTMVDDAEIEVVWVAKQDDAIDTEWYSQEELDVLCLARGRLRVEFADEHSPARTLREGDVLVIPPGTRCRAYRWPRESTEPAIFIAITPRAGGRDGQAAPPP